MNIYVDGTPLVRKRDGIGQLTKELLINTALLMPNDVFKVLVFKNDPPTKNEFPSNISFKVLPLNRRLYTAVFKLFRPLAINKYLDETPDLVIYPNFVTYPFIDGVRSLVFVYDLVFIDMPEAVEKKNLKYLTKFINWSVGRGAELIAISSYFKNELSRIYRLPCSSVHQIRPGVESPRKYDSETETKVLEGLGLKPDYILFVGTLQPGKNISKLIEAFTRLPKEIKQQHPLVLVGAMGWKSDGIRQQLEAAIQNGESIRHLGYTDDDTVNILYKNAILFVFPSLYEGFGLPVLEAMSYGAPVLSSKNTGLIDAAGDAAFEVAPGSVESIASGMQRILEEPKLRQELISKGTDHYKQLSWKRTGQDMREIIEKAIK